MKNQTYYTFNTDGLTEQQIKLLAECERLYFTGMEISTALSMKALETTGPHPENLEAWQYWAGMRFPLYRETLREPLKLSTLVKITTNGGQSIVNTENHQRAQIEYLGEPLGMLNINGGYYFEIVKGALYAKYNQIIGSRYVANVVNDLPELQTEKTQVVFLMEKEQTGETSTPWAYFPNVNESRDGSKKMCYAHTGQHSACAVEYANECRAARPWEYADLQKELEGIGYNLEIIAPNATQAFKAVVCPVGLTGGGAPMGRASNEISQRPADKRIFDRAVNLTDGYDKGGAYWGLGSPLRVEFTADLSYIRFYRQDTHTGAFKFTFKGRPVNAEGKLTKHVKTYTAKNLATAYAMLYAEYSHITPIKVTTNGKNTPLELLHASAKSEDFKTYKA